jgi:hypothetical protein
MTLWLQYTRRRKIDDATSLYFRVAMLVLAGLCVSGAGSILLIPAARQTIPRAAVWLGVLAIPGVFVSTITGMMYKITPFLNWLHLQRLGAPISAVPNMKKMIPADAMTGPTAPARAGLAAAAGGGLAAERWRVSPGSAFAGSCAWLGWNLIGAVRRYRTLQRSNSRSRFASLMVICLPLTAIRPLAARS